MVGVFHRSISLPVPNPKPNSDRISKAQAYHVRSISLPCRSQPNLTQLQHQIKALQSWQSESSSDTTSPSHLHTGLSLLELLHMGLDELLRLPKIHHSLRQHHSSAWVSVLLDDFLRLADAFGCFLDTLVSMQQLHAEAKVALRRKDEKSIAASMRSHRKLERDIAKVAAELRDISRTREEILTGDVDLLVVLKEARTEIASASLLVFTGFTALSASSFSRSSSTSTSYGWKVLSGSLKGSVSEEDYKRKLEGLKALEECNLGLESESSRVFRCLVNTRVSLLNILTP